MKTVIYAWENGNNLGHIKSFMPIAQRLKAQGYTILFSFPAYDSAPSKEKEWIEKSGFDFFIAPGSNSNNNSNLYKNKCRINCHASLFLYNIRNFNCSSSLILAIKCWQRIFKIHQADLIICDFAPSAKLAAEISGIQSITLDYGYLIPDVSNDLPLFDQTASPSSKALADNKKNESKEAQITASRQILTVINQALEHFNATPYTAFSDLFLHSKILYLNYPSISAFPHQHTDNFYGAILSKDNSGVLPLWPNANNLKPKIFSYLRKGSDNIKSIMSALIAYKTASILVYMPDCSEALKKTFNRPHLRISSEPFEITNTVKQADVVICTAGVGMITQTLLAGTPMLLLHNHNEQHLNANRVVNIKAALSINDSDSPSKITSKINEVLVNPLYLVNARSFKLKNKPADLNEIVHVIEERSALNKRYSDTQKEPSSLNFEAKHVDVVFISNGEPNANENWQHLLSMHKNSIRIDAEKNFTKTLTLALGKVNSERFIIVNASTRIDSDFFSIKAKPPTQLSKSVWHFSSVNGFNGIVNQWNGIEVWSKQIAELFLRYNVLDRFPLKRYTHTHDFYQLLPAVYSKSYVNGSPFQAFSAGFQQVILLLHNDPDISHNVGLEGLEKNLSVRMVQIWMCAGIEVNYGSWAMLGARLGLLYFIKNIKKIHRIENNKWMKSYWKRILKNIFSTSSSKVNDPLAEINETEIANKLEDIGLKIKEMYPLLTVLPMNAEQSIHFKEALSKQTKDVKDFDVSMKLSNL